MGVFKRNNSDELVNDKNAETIIGPSVKIEGSFIGDDNILVEGQVIGNLKTKGNLTVAQSAKIEADVEAQNLLVSGEIIGNIICHEKIDLTATAHITGDITTNIIAVETGAVIKGRCTTQINSPVNTAQEIATSDANIENQNKNLKKK